MKNYLPFLAVLVFSLSARAQNRITAPVGQTIKITADTTVVNGNLRLNTNGLFLNNQRFFSTSPDISKNNTFVGQSSGNLSMAGTSNTFLGASAGAANTGGNSNTFLGFEAGVTNNVVGTTSGGSNVFVGARSGHSSTGGRFNTYVGASSGRYFKSGAANTSESNTFVGFEAGYGSTATAGSQGNNNTYFGRAAGYSTAAGNNNTAIGLAAGYSNQDGSGNVFVGYQAGFNETGSNKLYIANSNTATPLIHGDFSLSRLVLNGQVGAGTANFPTSVSVNGAPTNVSGFKLFVKGGILTESIVVATGWADYVFDDNYKLKSLEEVEQYIKAHGHLSGIPSAGDLEKTGVNLGDMARLQQEKIEELTLYAIEHEKQIRMNQTLLVGQQKQIDQLRGMLQEAAKAN